MSRKTAAAARPLSPHLQIYRLILLGYTWALLHHMLGGIRHLIWDTGSWMQKETSTRLAWATIIGSVILTLLVWIAGYAARGAF
jgi:succinate dehydrogenase / fumarate reductase cytochrome b subunit